MLLGDQLLSEAEKDFEAKLSGDMIQISVPEMGTEKEPAVLYFKPSTLKQRDKIYRAVEAGGLGSLIEIIIVRARDEDGNLIFNNRHKALFQTKIDPDVTIRIVKELGEAEGIDIEDADAEPKKSS